MSIEFIHRHTWLITTLDVEVASLSASGSTGLRRMREGRSGYTLFLGLARRMTIGFRKGGRIGPMSEYARRHVVVARR